LAREGKAGFFPPGKKKPWLAFPLFPKLSISKCSFPIGLQREGAPKFREFGGEG